MKFFAPDGLQDVNRALALENLMLEDPAGEEGVLCCWSGEKAVVMGKNQNPWRECNLEVIRAENCKLARRISGGGAVYHDPGNLNISWILPREGYRAENMHGVLLRSLAALGIRADIGKGGGLTVDGKKISGSAFCYRRDRVLHHGTLLIDADLKALRAALSPPRFRMRTHAVASLPAAVVNLGEVNPAVTRQQVCEALVAEAEKMFGTITRVKTNPIQESRLEAEALRLGERDWLWGQTPGFTSQVDLPGGQTLHFRVHKGRLVECRRDNQSLEVDASPGFPDGEFSEVEKALALEPGAFSGILTRAGWVKI